MTDNANPTFNNRAGRKEFKLDENRPTVMPARDTFSQPMKIQQQGGSANSQANIPPAEQQPKPSV